MKNIKKISIIALAISPLAALTFTPSVVRHTNLERCGLTKLEKLVNYEEFNEINELLAKTYSHLTYEYARKTCKVLTIEDMKTWCNWFEDNDVGSKRLLEENLKRLKSIDVEKNLITNNYNNFSEESAKDLSYATIWAENYKKWVELEIKTTQLKLDEINKRLEILKYVKEKLKELEIKYNKE